MDTFAAISMASERYPNSLIRPDKNDSQKKDNTSGEFDDLEGLGEVMGQNQSELQSRKVFTPTMWRNIYGMSLYITLICVFFIVFGKSLFGLSYSAYDDDSTDKTKHYTIIFNVFIWANLFN
jgi:hypothetical protein